MPLTPGTTLGPYEILAPLGAGGMGEVYRARDTRLDRTVAIKVLPGHLSASPELQRRLEREAKAISQLSHPHICTLHDVGREGEVDFLVMEYLEGETLASRLEKGSLPLEQALRTASEIAGALDKAHRQGVVHRDLKPGNIMLTKSGAKLLDFGLAKLREAGVEDTGIESALPTQAQPLTEDGKIVGTYPYMAPEQLEGKAADARTDIFAFGAVLYEMVTGRRAFEGESRASLIAAIMSSDPRPIGELQPMTPRSLDRLVKRCLAKDRDERWQSAADLAAELRWVAESAGQNAGSPTPADRRPSRERLIWAGVSAVLLIGLAWSLSRTPAPEALGRAVVRAALPLAAGKTLARAEDFPLGVGHPSLAVSPDGSKVAFVVREGQGTRIHLRGLAEGGSTPLQNTEAGFAPFSLRTVSGSPSSPPTSSRRSLCGVARRSRSATRQLHSVGAGATTTGSCSRPKKEQSSHVSPPWAAVRRFFAPTFSGWPRWPQVLPGGRVVLLSALERSIPSGNPDYWSLIAFFPETGETKLVLRGGSFARYLPTGHVIYVRGGAVHAVPFDPERVEITGSPILVLDGVLVEGEGAAQLSYSEGGTLVYVPGGAMSLSELVWVDRDGTVEPLGFPPRPFGTFQLSPDGRRLVVVVNERRPEVWIYDLVRRTRDKLALEGAAPIWAPDGERVVFASVRDNRNVLCRRDVDGTGGLEVLVPGDRMLWPFSWTPDGRILAVASQSSSNDGGLELLAMDGERKMRPFLDTAAFEWMPDISPDGRWVAYLSDTSGQYEIYVQPFPGGGRTWTISTSGGTSPIWSPRGDELFFRNGDRWMSVPVSLGSGFSAGTPRELFRGPFSNVWERSYDVGPEARRFLLLRPVAGGEQQEPQLILNWFEELKQKMREAE